MPSGDSAASAGSSNFFGGSHSDLFTSDLAIEVDLFKGDTVFKPVDWLMRIKPVFDFNHVDFQETGQVSPNPRGYAEHRRRLGTPPNNSDVNNPGDVGLPPHRRPRAGARQP